MTVRRGHITFKRDGYVGSLSLGGYGLGRGAAHQETAGMFGGGGHFGEGAVIVGSRLLHKGRKGCAGLGRRGVVVRYGVE